MAAKPTIRELMASLVAAVQDKLNVTIEAGDISIGGVELKDASADMRAKVRTVGSTGALDVSIVNANGEQITELGGGGGGGAATIADGADVAEGHVADAPDTNVESVIPKTGISLWKSIKNYLKILADNQTRADAARTAATLVQPVQIITSAGAPVDTFGSPAVTNALLGGATSDAAVTTNSTGSIHQYLRGLVALIVAKINIATVDTVTTITNAVGITSALLGGATSDAAVTTNSTGSIHQYLRGLVALIVAKINIATVDTVTTITNAVGITSALLGGATSDAAVTTNSTGSIHQYLRGLVALVVAKIGVTIAAGDDAAEGNTTNDPASVTAAEDATGRTVISLLKGIKNIFLVQRAVFGIDMTPTLTVHATYASGDFVGTSGAAITFANAARFSGGGGMVVGAEIDDYGKRDVALELWLFDTAPTPPNDSDAWTISDAHSARLVGVIPFSTFYDTALNSISIGVIPNGALPYLCAATSLFGCLVTRGAPAYADGDLTVRLFVQRD